MNIRKQFYVFLLCLLTYAMNMAVGAEEGNVDFRLTILHNDDSESQLIDAGPGLEDFGGVARFATLAQKLRFDGQTSSASRNKRGVMVVTSGDNIFPGPELNASIGN